MFAANKKVSSRQLNRIIITENIAIALLIGGYLAGELASLSYIWLFGVGLAVSMAYMWAVLKISEKYADRLLKNKLFNIFSCIRFTAMAGMGLYIFYHMVKNMLLKETAGLIIILGITLLSLYVSSKQYEERGRLHQILGIFVILLILIIMITATLKIDLPSAFSDLSSGLKLPDKTGIKILLFMILLTGYYEKLIIVSPHYYNSYGKRLALMKAPVVIWVLALWAYILCVNIFGMGASLFKLMDIGGIPGDFLNRQETIMAVFLIISLTSYVSGMFYYIRQCIKNIFIRYTDKPHILTRRIVSVIVILVVVCEGIALGIKTDGMDDMAGGEVIGGREIEKWNFVMSMVIAGGSSPCIVLELADTDSENGTSRYVVYGYDDRVNESEILTAINRKHMETGNNETDFSHIKGIILYDMSDEEQEKIIAEFKRNNEISGNVSVYKATSETYPDLLSDITDSEKSENLRLGTMLENMVKNMDKYSGNVLYKMK